MGEKLRVWTAYRVSTDRQGLDGDDIPMQSSQCHVFTEQKGWLITKEITEKLSGYKTSIEDRETLKILKQGAADGEYDILLLYHSDRLGRQMEYSLWIASLYELGVQVWSVKEGELKNQEHRDALMNFIRYWLSEGESKKMSMRVKDSMRQLNEEGNYLGGTIPYGYQLEDTGEKRNSRKNKTIKKLVINPKEAKIVKMIFEWVTDRLVGGSVIAQELNAMGLHKRGNLWRHNTITRMLRNPVYMGYKKYNVMGFKGDRTKDRRELSRDKWILQPFNPELVIVSEEQFKKVQEIMDKRVEKTGASSESRIPLSSKVLLSGLAVCGYCGHKLKADFANKKNKRKDGSVQEYRTYRYSCHHAKNNPVGHNQRAFGAVTIDKYVEEEVFKAIGFIKLEAFKIDSLKKEIEEAELTSSDLDRLKYQMEDWVNIYKSIVSLEQKKVMLSRVVHGIIITKESILIRFKTNVEKALEDSLDIGGNDDHIVNESGPGYTIKCETEGNPHTHEVGSLSMAYAGRDTGGSQFFIVHEPQPHLNGVHTVFGKVTSAIDAVLAMRNGDVMEKVEVVDA